MKTPSWFKTLQRNFDILAGDLSLTEMEYLIKKDAPGLYEFYSREFNINRKRNFFVRWASLTKNLFFAFIKKLKPARRLVYLVGLYFFGYGILYVHQISIIGGFLLINLLLALELADKITMRDELEIARRIQLQLLPDKAPVHPQLDIVYFMETAHEVGGDFYDFIPLGEKLVVVIGDISGKGMAAAIHMVQMHTIVRGLQHVDSPGHLLCELNKGLIGILPKSVFLTSGLFAVNGTGDIELYRSGHLPILSYTASNRQCQALQPSGIGIGLAGPEVFEKSLQSITLQPEQGDVYVLYTDGLVETMDPGMQEYGEERLSEVLCVNADKDAAGIRDAILSSVASFRGRALQHDDLTLIVIKYKG